MQQLYAELLLDHARLKDEVAQTGEENVEMKHKIDLLQNEIEDLKAALGAWAAVILHATLIGRDCTELRHRDVQGTEARLLEAQQKSSVEWTRQLQLEQKIQELEHGVTEEFMRSQPAPRTVFCLLLWMQTHWWCAQLGT